MQALWDADGLDELDVQDEVVELVDRSLLRRNESGLLTLHDLQGDYAKAQLSNEEQQQLHCKLVDGYSTKCQNGWARGPDDGYFFECLPYHMKQGGRPKELKELLVAYEWLEAKLQATDVVQLVADFSLLSEDDEAKLVADALRLSAHYLAREKGLLRSQLHGRLLAAGTPGVRRLIEDASGTTPWPAR